MRTIRLSQRKCTKLTLFVIAIGVCIAAADSVAKANNTES